eukprot:3223107-Pyramimonas_sp.AAC.2
MKAPLATHLEAEVLDVLEHELLLWGEGAEGLARGGADVLRGVLHAQLLRVHRLERVLVQLLLQHRPHTHRLVAVPERLPADLVASHQAQRRAAHLLPKQ